MIRRTPGFILKKNPQNSYSQTQAEQTNEFLDTNNFTKHPQTNYFSDNFLQKLPIKDFQQQKILPSRNRYQRVKNNHQAVQKPQNYNSNLNQKQEINIIPTVFQSLNQKKKFQNKQKQLKIKINSLQQIQGASRQKRSLRKKGVKQSQIARYNPQQKSEKQISSKSNNQLRSKTKKKQLKYIPNSSPLKKNSQVLPQQKLLQEPYFQYIYEQQNQTKSFSTQNILDPQQKISELDQKITEFRYQEDVSLIQKLFNQPSLSNIRIGEPLKNNQSYNNYTNQYLDLLTPYKLYEHIPNSILPSVQLLIKEHIWLKRLYDLMTFKYQSKSHSSNNIPKSYQNVYALIEYIHTYFQSYLRQIQLYEGIGQLFAADNKIQQIKRFFLFQRIQLIVLVFILTKNKFQEYKNYLINIIKFSIENIIILLNNFISSKSLHYMIHKYYPNLLKKGLEFIQVNNDSINEILHKLSVIDELFFSNINKLAKKCVKFQLNLILKQFLQFLAFSIHKNQLEVQGKYFSTVPGPFINADPQKYYLVIDATHFVRKDSKGNTVFRPFYDNFLKQMGQRYQIINYSYWSPRQAKQILQNFDRNSLIKHHLYSHHFQVWPKFYRCLQKIGVNEQRLIYLGFDQNQEDIERIRLKGWNGDKKDRQIIDILPVLIAISHLRLNCAEVIQQLKYSNANINMMQQKLLKHIK